MRALKVLGILVFFVALGRYFPVFYNTMQFNDFVQQEARRTRQTPQLRQTLLLQAQMNFLPVKSEDIHITENEDVIRVKVDYKVPVDFFVFKHELRFSASGAGPAAH